MPAIECIQRAAEKKVCSEEDFIKGNKLSFGDSIGSVTNVVTSMICLQANFDPNSKEYETLAYRIICGQMFQQNCIDKAKGIIADPMPLRWRSVKECRPKEGDDKDTIAFKNFNASIAAEKKPYFMRYRYAKSNNEYKEFESQAYLKYKLLDTDKEYKEIIYSENNKLTQEELQFKNWYHYNTPVVDSNCTINNICHIVEDRFDGIRTKNKTQFNPSVLKTDTPYSKTNYKLVEKIYNTFKREQQNAIKAAKSKVKSSTDMSVVNQKLYNYLRYMYNLLIISKEDLTNILIDICYSKEGSKDIVWEVCGDQIIENLLNRHNRTLYYPKETEGGNITYLGFKYSMEPLTVLEAELDEEEIVNED